MSDYQKGFESYAWLEPSWLELAAKSCENPNEFEKGYWDAENKDCELKEQMDKIMDDVEG
jgi:hypothetical protein